jgi:hypothetical protein
MTKPSDIQKYQAALDMYALLQSEQRAADELGIPRPTMQGRLARARALKLVPAQGLDDHGSPKVLAAKVKQLEAALKASSQRSTDLDIIKGVIGAMASKAAEYQPPEWTISPATKAHHHGVPTLFLSDLHWGEVVHPSQINGVNQYNVRIAKERLRTCVERAVSLLRIISPDLKFPGIVVPLGGDMISGNIHEELTATNEINSMPAVLDLYGELRTAITVLADTFGHVFLPCVTGNHGRDTHKIWGKDRHHTSFDWLLYQFLAKHFEHDKRVQFFIPDGPDAYYRIYGHRYLLTHGDQFRGGDGVIGALGPIIRGDHRKRSRNSQIDMEYDTMIIGHWHQWIMLRRLIVNGSLKGYDEYAYSNNFPFEEPQQGLWLTHPENGITIPMPVRVDKQKQAARKTSWVSFAG